MNIDPAWAFVFIGLLVGVSTIVRALYNTDSQKSDEDESKET